MKWFSFLFLMFAYVSTHAATYHHAGSYQFTSPIPGSSLVSRQTNIILRPGELIDPSTINNNWVHVVGTVSGLHTGTLNLSDDGRTLVFTPTLPFESGEKVSVTVQAGIKTVRGTTLGPESLSFTITSSPPRLPDRSRDGGNASDHASWVRQDLQGSPEVQGIQSLPDSLPVDFPTITVLHSANPSPGGIFLSNFVFGGKPLPNSNYLMILDNSGKPLSYRKTPESSMGFTLQPNGMLSYCLTTPEVFDTGIFFVADTSYTVVDTFLCKNGYFTDPHELRLLPNGHALIIGFDYQDVRMDTIVSGGDPNARVKGNIIQELDLSKNVVFQWRSWDHYRIVDAIHENLLAGVIDYVHMNAIDVDTDGNLLVSSRNLEEITKINRQTGEIIWRLGGKNNQFTFVNDPIGFTRQHAIRRIPNGHITLFDNGNHHTPRFSRAVEYELNESARTATLVWEYRNTPEEFSEVMGYVQRLDNGNTIIGWGNANPSVTEVRPDGSKALELTLPSGQWSYRAYRFPWPPIRTGVSGQQTPSSYILEQNYPNPFNPTTTIRYVLPSGSHARLTIINALGQIVRELVNGEMEAGYHEVQFDAGNLASGVYFYRMQAGPFVETRKLILLR